MHKGYIYIKKRDMLMAVIGVFILNVLKSMLGSINIRSYWEKSSYLSANSIRLLLTACQHS